MSFGVTVVPPEPPVPVVPPPPPLPPPLEPPLPALALSLLPQPTFEPMTPARLAPAIVMRSNQRILRSFMAAPPRKLCLRAHYMRVWRGVKNTRFYFKGAPAVPPTPSPFPTRRR